MSVIVKMLFLNDAQIRRLIPGFLLLNNDLQIIDAADSVKNLFNISSYTRFTDIFTLNEPLQNTTSFNYLQSFATQAISVVAIKSPGLTYALKVECLDESEQLLLVFADLFPEKEQKQAADNARFIYAITHELKNPLAAIQSSAELIQLKQERAGKEASFNTSAHLEAIFSEVDKVALVLKNIGFISANATICLKPTSTQLEPFIQNVLQYSFLNHFENRAFHVAVAGTQRSVMIDQQLFSQVIVNLVDAVMQYSKRDEPIRITILFSKNQVKLMVEDQQALMPESAYDQYEKILNANRIEDLNGTKEWGLFVVKKIVNAHKGMVNFSGKKGLNAGFVFSIDY